MIKEFMRRAPKEVIIIDIFELEDGFDTYEIFYELTVLFHHIFGALIVPEEFRSFNQHQGPTLRSLTIGNRRLIICLCNDTVVQSKFTFSVSKSLFEPRKTLSKDSLSWLYPY